VIVVEGGSSDKTVEVAKEFADKVVIDSKRPVGAVRNAGARIVSGDVLAFIDADTVACPFWIETITQSFNDNCLVGVTGPTLPLDGTSLIDSSIRQ
jgi:glycosyltransferase involved in cell wall biosynthesis